MNDYRVPRPADETDLAMDAIAVMWEEVDFYRDPETLARTLQGSTPGQRAVHACTWYGSEVINGGHDQFFFNATGALWPEALEGFTLLGAPDHARILADVIALFGPTPPSRDAEERQHQVNRLYGDGDRKLFEPYDRAFWALQESAPTYVLFEDYIRAHPDEFFR